MVYVTPTDLGWVPYVNSWMKRMFHPEDGQKTCLNKDAQIFLRELFDSFVDDTLDKLKDYKEFEPIPTVEIQNITRLCDFLEYFISEDVGKFTIDDSKESFRPKLIRFFAYSFIWSVGGSFSTRGYRYVDQIMRRNFSKLIPPQETVFEYQLNLENMKFEPWNVPEFEYDKELPYFSILVPTIDT